MPPQEYYIAAAWSDPDNVPTSFLVGDGSKTVANGVTYENVALKSDTDYVHLIRIDIQSDTNEVRRSSSYFILRYMYIC